MTDVSKGLFDGAWLCMTTAYLVSTHKVGLFVYGIACFCDSLLDFS